MTHEARNLLEDSEERFRTLVANIPGAVYRCACDGQFNEPLLRRMVFLSEAIQDISGYTPSDFINNRVRSFASIIHPQDRVRIEQVIWQSISAKQPYIVEYRIVRANGSFVWVYDKGQGIWSESEDILWLDGVILDITEQKKTEIDLQDTQAFLNSILENLPVGVFIKDANELRIMYWNKASEELFGYSKEDVLGKNDYEFLPQQPARFLRAQDRQVLAQGNLVDIPEDSAITPHRGKRFVHTKKVPLCDERGIPRYLLSICEDITERKRAEEALRESEAHYRRIVETASEGVWMFDADSKTIFANSRIAEMLGYTVEELLGRSLFDFMDEESRVQAQTYVERRRQGMRERHDFKFCRKDGSVLWAMVSATPIFDAQGQFVGVLRMITDISDRKHAEEALRESHQQIADILERITDAFFALDEHWQFTYINTEASRTLRRHPEKLIGTNFWDMFPEMVGSLVEQQYRQAVTEQQPVIFETFFQRLNSWVEVRAYPSGSGLSVFWRDITQRKHSEEALRKSEEQYRTLASHFPNGVVLAFDRELRYTLAEGEALGAIGLSKEFVEGKTLWEVGPPEICEILDPYYRAALAGRAGVFEMQYANRTYLVHTLPLKNPYGDVFAGMVMKQDITDRKRAEQHLQEREQFLRSIYDGVENSIFVVDVLEKDDTQNSLHPSYEFRYRGFNPAHERLTGLHSDLLRGKTPQEVFPPAVATTVSKHYEECARAGIAISYEECLPIRTKNTWWITTLTPLRDRHGRIYRLVGTSINISDRKHVEEALRESERRFRAIFDSMFQFIGLLKPDGTLLEANQTALDFGGMRLEDIAGRPFWEAHWWSLYPQTQERLKAAIAKAAAGEFVRYEVDVLGAGDHVITIDFSLKPVKDETGQVVLLIPEGRDISDKKQAEKALRESEQRFRATFDQAAVGIAHVDLDGKFLRINQKFCDLVGYTQEEMLTHSLQDITHPDDLEVDLADVHQVLSGEIQMYSVEKRYISRNRGIVWINLTVSLRRRSSGEPKYFISVVQDISDRKQAEVALRRSESQLRLKNQQLQKTLCQLKHTQTQLIQNEKMVSLGQMVAGIAHEINNPISFIYGNITYADEYAQYLLNLVNLYRFHYPEPVREIQDEIEAFDLDFIAIDFPKVLRSMQEGANRIREIVLSLRNFSRLDEAEIKPVNLHEGIDNTLLILQHRLKGHAGKPEIEVRKEYRQLPLVECYAGSLNQVFMNLLINAIDALEPQSAPRVISICTELKAGKNPANPQSVIIRIADNGPGIPSNVKQQIFDPFFTTKPIGVGTGLGLSIAYSIVVKKHRGTLTCHSVPGEGAEFVIELPVRQPKPS